MAKRAQTDYCFIVGIDKPAGVTSHDVVDRCRHIYGERRIGHTGTLDPAATGVLVLCVGPATRLDRFFVGHNKTYDFTCVFGTQTSTDDSQGSVVETCSVPDSVLDIAFAQDTLRLMEGPAMQIPPAYSSVKIGGKTAYKEARAGRNLDLKPRSVDIYALQLLGISTTDTGAPVWEIRAFVSSGTYIRSLARDLGNMVGSCAHVGTLRRLQSGSVDISECVSLDALEQDPFRYLLDPVKLLGLRFAFVEGALAKKVDSGGVVNVADINLFEYANEHLLNDSYCACSSGVVQSVEPLSPNEAIALVSQNKLVAIYSFDNGGGVLKSICGFSKGVQRGGNL